jgi:hypothetical protein
MKVSPTPGGVLRELHSTTRWYAKLVEWVASQYREIPSIVFVRPRGAIRWLAIPLHPYSEEPEEGDTLSRATLLVATRFKCMALPLSGDTRSKLRDVGSILYEISSGLPLEAACLIGEGVQLHEEDGVESMNECAIVLTIQNTGSDYLVGGMIHKIERRDPCMRLTIIEAARIYGVADEDNILLHLFNGWGYAHQQEYAQYN